MELYLTTPMTTAQVVECLGYPTRQCLERWLAKDPRYAGHMAKPIIPLETKDQGDRTGAGRHARKRAAELFGAGVGLRRLSDREKTLLIDRLRPACSLGSMTCLPGIAPSSHLLPPRQARG